MFLSRQPVTQSDLIIIKRRSSMMRDHKVGLVWGLGAGDPNQSPAPRCTTQWRHGSHTMSGSTGGRCCAASPGSSGRDLAGPGCPGPYRARNRDPHRTLLFLVQWAVGSGHLPAGGRYRLLQRKGCRCWCRRLSCAVPTGRQPQFRLVDGLDRGDAHARTRVSWPEMAWSVFFFLFSFENSHFCVL